MKMDDLSDLAPQMAAGASPEVFHQLGMITRQLHDTLTQLGVMPKLQIAADGLPDARSRQLHRQQDQRRRQQGADLGRPGQGRPRPSAARRASSHRRAIVKDPVRPWPRAR